MGPAHLRSRHSPPGISWTLSFHRLYRPLCLTLRSHQGLVLLWVQTGTDLLGLSPASAIAPVMQPRASHRPVFPFCYLLGGNGGTCLAEWSWRLNRSEQEFRRTRAWSVAGARSYMGAVTVASLLLFNFLSSSSSWKSATAEAFVSCFISVCGAKPKWAHVDL